MLETMLLTTAQMSLRSARSIGCAKGGKVANSLHVALFRIKFAENYFATHPRRTGKYDNLSYPKTCAS
jgi:hypothetical protein